jgi:hypothetical protein
MDPHDFHQLALQLAHSSHAAELRTAISRAYYATYHVSVTLLEAMHFRLSRGPAGHGEVRNRLSNSGDPEVMRVGTQLGQLQSQRIAADYRLHHTSVENPDDSDSGRVLCRAQTHSDYAGDSRVGAENFRGRTVTWGFWRVLAKGNRENSLAICFSVVTIWSLYKSF